MKLKKITLCLIIISLLLPSCINRDFICYPTSTTAKDIIETEPDTEATKETTLEIQEETEEIERHFIVNISTNKYHNEDCRYVGFMNEENKLFITSTPEKLRQQEYKPCSHCQN